MKLKQKFPIDWLIVLPVMLLLTFGLFAIYSATVNNPAALGNFNRQVIWMGVAVLISGSFYFINLKTFQILSFVLYGISILLLIAVLIFGTEVAGNKSWLQIGSVGLQPSEFTKFTTVLMFASYLSTQKSDKSGLIQVVIGMTIILIPVALILAQPDTGTCLVFIGMSLPILFWIGLDDALTFMIISPVIAAGLAFFNFYLFLGYVVICIAFIFYVKMKPGFAMLTALFTISAGFLTVFFVENILLPHQRKRLEILLDPLIDPKGAGYNIIQSEIAIGSGGFLGKGFLAGTQTQLGFLPKQWTDFIFCVVSEEYGFLGSSILLLCFLILLWRLLVISTKMKSRFASIFTIGVFMVIAIHVFINLAMTMGLLPIIGIPLPFVSYGGSSMITFMAMIGTVMSIYAHQTSEEY